LGIQTDNCVGLRAFAFLAWFKAGGSRVYRLRQLLQSLRDRTFMRMVATFDFDVMVEAKVTNLALVRLRPDLLRYAPDVADRFGIQPSEIDGCANEEDAAMETG